MVGVIADGSPGRPGGGATPPGGAEALNQKVMELYKAGRYQEALPLARRVLEIREKARKAEYPDIAASLNNLALLYKTMGAYEQALPLYLRALQITEKALGPEHPDTATLVNNLAVLYRAMGAYEQALPLYQRALQIRKSPWGRSTPTPPSSITWPGYTGPWAPMSRLCPCTSGPCKIREKALGPEHPDTATSLNNLAFWYNLWVPMSRRCRCTSGPCKSGRRPWVRSTPTPPKA